MSLSELASSMTSSRSTRTGIPLVCITALLLTWGSAPSLSAAPAAKTQVKSIAIRKGIQVNGQATDVEIKELQPALAAGVDAVPSPSADLAPVPEIYAFERIEHPQNLPVEEAKKLVCRAGLPKVTKEALDSMIKDAKSVPARHRLWARYLVFFTQGSLKAMYVVYNFDDKPVAGVLSASPYLLEDGVYKSWLADFDKQAEFQKAFSISSVNDLARFFHEAK